MDDSLSCACPATPAETMGKMDKMEKMENGSGTGRTLACLAISAWLCALPLQAVCHREEDKAGAGPQAAGLTAVTERLLERLGDFVPAFDGDREGMEGGEMLLQMAQERLSARLRHPLDINRASRRDLEELGLLTGFQISSLLDYRSRNGYILSGAELELLNGFHASLVESLRPFIFFGDPPGALDWNGTAEFGGRRAECGWGSRCRTALSFKSSWQKPREGWLDVPLYLQLRCRCELDGRFGAGIILEKDPGEPVMGKNRIPMGDFIAAHVAVRGLRLGRKGWSLPGLYGGDFLARFGQGLVLWNGFSLGTAASPEGLFRRAEPVIPYLSSEENRFFRGVAATLRKSLRKLREVDFTGFFSYKKVDARVENGKYTSIVDGGLHQTPGLLLTRRQLPQCVYGASLAYHGLRMKIGLNWVSYFYGAENGRRVQEYNRLQQFNGIYGNLSADFCAVWGKSRLFGEAAVDYGGKFALLCGWTSRLGEWNTGLLVRYYPPEYIAPFAGAVSCTSGCFNQIGLSCLADRWIGRSLQLSSGVEVCRFPHARFRVPDASWQWRCWVRLERETRRQRWNLRCYASADSGYRSWKAGVRGMFSRQFLPWLALELRGETVYAGRSGPGGCAAADLAFSFLQRRIGLRLRGAFYHCREWESRLYLYEADLPLSFVSGLCYGKGCSGYLLAHVKLWGRQAGKGEYALFVKADTSPKMKIGARMEF